MNALPEFIINSYFYIVLLFSFNKLSHRACTYISVLIREVYKENYINIEPYHMDANHFNFVFIKQKIFLIILRGTIKVIK